MTKHKNTYQGKVSDKLTSMEVGDNFSKKEFIEEHWKDYNFWLDRSFSVFFAKSKKLLPDKTFSTIKGFIHRLT